MMRLPFLALACVFSMLALLPYSTVYSLQSPAYLRIGGISGGSHEMNHKEWFELISVDQGAYRWTLKDQTGLFLPEGVGSMGPGKMTVTRIAREGSSELHQAALYGTYFGTVHVDLPISLGMGSKYMKWTLRDVTISDVLVQRSQERWGAPIEQITFSFQGATWDRGDSATAFQRNPTQTSYLR